MKLGLDVFLEKEFTSFIGKRIGLVTNITGVNKNLVPTIDLFFAHPDIQLVALYGPEHGIYGDAKEGEEIESLLDRNTGLPVYSLYGKTRKPTPEMLEPIDVMIFDLQDIGSRYYTFIYTLANVMEACGEKGIPVVVLDRPNPIGGSVEGNLLEPDYQSFVGMFPIPNRHGLTIGELALLYVHEFGINCEVRVIPMDGWKRDMYFNETGFYWVQPTPNTTGLDMCTLYPGTCLVEGTNLSEGRGTTRPFEMIGAPFINGYELARNYNAKKSAGVIARPVTYKPTYSKYKDERCEGIQVHISNRKKVNTLKAGLTLLETIIELYPDNFSFIKGEKDGKYFFDLLSGTGQLRQSLLDGHSSTFLEHCHADVEHFRKKAAAYKLYK